eukprot:6100260-Amphidinium_carterae.1
MPQNTPVISVICCGAPMYLPLIYGFCCSDSRHGKIDLLTRCWDATFSFERCCQGKPAVSQAAVGQASEKLDALRGELAQCRKESDALTKDGEPKLQSPHKAQPQISKPLSISEQ